MSDGGDVVEVSLWNQLPEGPCAVVLPNHVLTRPEHPGSWTCARWGGI